MSKKIGIITFQNANNYGAVLQAFALQNSFEKRGCDTSIINYDSAGMGLKSVQTSYFKDFNSRYLNLTDEYSRKDDIETNGYDLLLTGSDQVWNPVLTHSDSTYFLDFADDDIRKSSYAASIGIIGDELVKRRDFFDNNLKGIRDISIRENGQKVFLSEITGKAVNVNVDPTLLLDEADYRKAFNITPYQGNYIFMYSNNIDPKMIDFVNLLSLKTGMKIVSVSANEEAAFTSGSKTFRQVNPTEWILAISGAAIVVTDSFHGLMFSLIFEKPFYIYTKKRSNISRITEILEKCGLQDRTLKDIYSVQNVNTEMDFTKKREYIMQEKQRSFDYLDSLLI